MRTPATVSIRDVAEAAKISATTVSRTLSNPGLVTESTRRRVLAAVQSSGNPMARSLRCRKTNAVLVLVLVSDIANPFFPQVIKGIESTAHALGYRILLGNTHHNAIRERSYTQLAEQHQVDGIILLSDDIAIGAIRAAKRHGLKVPEELSVVGFDDIAFAGYCDPPLTTVRQPRAEIGQQPMQSMYREIQGKTLPRSARWCCRISSYYAAPRCRPAGAETVCYTMPPPVPALAGRADAQACR